MPNYGRSGRCLTCRRRHVKCDEAKPACSPCRRLGLDCGGYAKDYSFRDQSHKFGEKTSSPTTSEGQDALVRYSTAAKDPSRSLWTGSDVAVPFFLVHYAGMGRRLAPARGFYETLIPVYTSQPNDSPLSLALSAVAERIISLWYSGNDFHNKPNPNPYTKAVASLRSALDHPEDRRRPATALAVLTLHLYETFSAVFDDRPVTPVHHHGALSLLRIMPRDDLDGLICTYVNAFVLHTEISSALRQKRVLHPVASSYLSGSNGSSLMPGNYSSTLDVIGASIAELQADYVRGMSQRQVPLLDQQCRVWINEARRIDDLLLSWMRDVPKHWWPVRLTSQQDFDTSITAYQSACDIYPSCQIATLWNLWRFHRLLLLKITIGSAQRISSLPLEQPAGGDGFMPMTLESALKAESIQELVDSICYSVPFYLGNRINPSSMSDFTDPDILFPSYHVLAQKDPRVATRQENGDDTLLSDDEHRRHILAYGAWHVVSPLSNLLTLFSDDLGGRLVASSLQSDQKEWVCEQFLRVSTLVRLPSATPHGVSKAPSPSLSPFDPGYAPSTAEDLAQQIRKRVIFMSGP